MGWCPACISPSLAGEQPCCWGRRASQHPAAWPLPITVVPSCARGSFRDEKFPRVPMFSGWRKGRSECSSLDRMTCPREPWNGCCHLAAMREATVMKPTQQQGQSRRLRDNQARGPQRHRLLSPGNPRLPEFEPIALYFPILTNSEHLIELITFFPNSNTIK